MKEPTAAPAPRNLIGNSNQPQVARHDPAKNDNTVKIRELVDRQVQAWEKHDFGIAAPDWLPSGELISPGGHVPAEEMQTAMAGYFKQFRDLRVTVKNVFISTDGAKAAIEWDWDVTRRRDGAWTWSAAGLPLGASILISAIRSMQSHSCGSGATGSMSVTAMFRQLTPN